MQKFTWLRYALSRAPYIECDGGGAEKIDGGVTGVTGQSTISTPWKFDAMGAKVNDIRRRQRMEIANVGMVLVGMVPVGILLVGIGTAPRKSQNCRNSQRGRDGMTTSHSAWSAHNAKLPPNRRNGI